MGKLGKGSYFGGRSLLANEIKKDGTYYLKDNCNNPSKVSVIVDSPTAVIYIIDKKSLFFVG